MTMIIPNNDFCVGSYPANPSDKSIEKSIARMAEVFLRNRKIRNPAKKAREIARLINQFAKTYKINPLLLAALFAKESGFNQNARSFAGAVGIAQLMPHTAKIELKISNINKLDQNINGGAKYMRNLIARFSDKPCPTEFALAGYKEGPTRVRKNNGYNKSSKQYIDQIRQYFVIMHSKEISVPAISFR